MQGSSSSGPSQTSWLRDWQRETQNAQKPIVSRNIVSYTYEAHEIKVHRAGSTEDWETVNDAKEKLHAIRAQLEDEKIDPDNPDDKNFLDLITEKTDAILNEVRSESAKNRVLDFWKSIKKIPIFYEKWQLEKSIKKKLSSPDETSLLSRIKKLLVKTAVKSSEPPVSQPRQPIRERPTEAPLPHPQRSQDHRGSLPVQSTVPAKAKLSIQERLAENEASLKAVNSILAAFSNVLDRRRIHLLEREQTIREALNNAYQTNQSIEETENALIKLEEENAAFKKLLEGETAETQPSTTPSRTMIVNKPNAPEPASTSPVGTFVLHKDESLTAAQKGDLKEMEELIEGKLDIGDKKLAKKPQMRQSKIDIHVVSPTDRSLMIAGFIQRYEPCKKFFTTRTDFVNNEKFQEIKKKLEGITIDFNDPLKTDPLTDDKILELNEIFDMAEAFIIAGFSQRYNTCKNFFTSRKDFVNNEKFQEIKTNLKTIKINFNDPLVTNKLTSLKIFELNTLFDSAETFMQKNP